MADKPDYEMQLTAMKTIMEALAPLEKTARESVLAWVTTQLGMNPVRVTKQNDNSNRASIDLTGNGSREGTVNVVTQRLNAQSARELLLAAATHLTVYQGKETFTKAELVERAKEARNWKANHSNQIPINIRRMLDAGELFEKARDVFSLSESTLKVIEERLET